MTTRRSRGRSLATLAAATFFISFLTPTPAGADTSTATARAMAVTSSVGVGASSGTISSTSDGVAPDASDASSPISSLGVADLAGAGVLVASTRAEIDGSSAACAGVVGSGGSISIGPAGDCTAVVGTPGQVEIVVSALVSVRADAIVASCKAGSDGTTSTTTSLIGASIQTSAVSSIGLPTSPSPNTGASVPAVLTLTTHGTSTPSGAGSVAANAIVLDALASTLAVNVGRVTCGPNTVTVPTPIVPLAAIPILGAGLIVGAVIARTRRVAL